MIQLRFPRWLAGLLIVSMLLGSFLPLQAIYGAPCATLAGAWCAETETVRAAALGQAAPIAVTVVSRDYELSDTIVDVEIYNVAGERVVQKVFEHQHLARGARKEVRFDWTPQALGTYTVKVGLFTAGWSYLHFWTDAAGTIQVGNAAPVTPPVIPVPTPTPPPVTPATPVITLSSPTVWWPAEGAAVTGNQPFKAVVESVPMEGYDMFWQVDGGQLNRMETVMADGAHKEVVVDVSSWNWRGAGPYRLTFVARTSDNRTVQKDVTIFVQPASSSLQPSSQPIAPAPAPVTPPVTLPPTQGQGVTMQINGSQAHAISPFIYGTNFQADEASWDGTSRNLTLARFGGNRLSTYNWENNASNAGSDWQQQNDGYLGGGDTPAGAVRSRIALAHTANAAALVTVPMLGYVAEDKQGDGDVSRSANYLDTRFNRTVAKKYAPFSATPNLADNNVYQDEFVNILEQSFPYADTDDARTIFYSLDNEPDLWSHTHSRLQQGAVSYATLINKSIEYASAIKDVAPAGLVFGASNYGFNGFESLQNAPDAAGRNFIDVYLAGMAGAEEIYGRRLLDVLDIHWYPEAQGDGQRITEDQASPGIAAARIQAPRSLWDNTYREESWIADVRGPIALLPRLGQQINTHYPGTKLAVTEYYYGGGNHISGALAQADVLGIFGRENVFAANLWHLGNTDDRFIYGAFAMFRNFDGQGSAFGNTGLAAATSDQAKSSVYASIDANNPNRAIVIVINKTAEPLAANLALSGLTQFASAAVYQLTSATSQPIPARSQAVGAGNAFTYTMPAYSVSTLVLTR